MTNKTTLITGATGCVGQYITNYLLKESNYKLFLLVRDASKLNNKLFNNPRVKILTSDLRECNKHAEDIAKVNFLIHTATAWGDPKRAYEVNVFAVEKLLDLLNPDCIEKVLYFSTASILDENLELISETSIYGTEYIQTKAICFKQISNHNLSKRIIAIFPTLVLGGTLDKNNNLPISYLTSGLLEALRWLWIARFFSLDSKFHFIHAEDISKVCFHLLEHEQQESKPNQIKKHVLGQDLITIDEAINTLLKWTNSKRFFSIPLSNWLIQILIKILPIEITPWDSYSIKKRHFNHNEISNPETFGIKSYAKDFNEILKVSKLPKK